MTQTIRIRPTVGSASGRRTGWIKQITSVDSSKSNGYAFEGEFLTAGQEVDLPVGAILVRVDPEGSVKNAYQSGHIYRLQADGEMEELESGDWRDDFLTLRDAASDALEENLARRAPEPAIDLAAISTADLVAEIQRRGAVVGCQDLEKLALGF